MLPCPEWVSPFVLGPPAPKASATWFGLASSPQFCLQGAESAVILCILHPHQAVSWGPWSEYFFVTGATVDTNCNMRHV